MYSEEKAYCNYDKELDRFIIHQKKGINTIIRKEDYIIKDSGKAIYKKDGFILIVLFIGDLVHLELFKKHGKGVYCNELKI